MVTSFLSTIAKSVRSLNPKEVRELAERQVNVGLMARNEAGLNRMWSYLAPDGISEAKRRELIYLVHPMGPRLPEMPELPAKLDLEIWEEGMKKPSHAFTFIERNPEATVRQIIEKREDIGLALSRQFPAFRRPMTDKVISAVCNENTLFSLATALPNIVPNFLALPFAIGEFASDTAFLTMNQLRMAFLLAAANDRPVGYREQRSQVASVVASAFGWRALARELVSKIPFGAGAFSKGVVAYGGTWVVGKSLEKLYRTGGKLTRAERKTVYDEGVERGKTAAKLLLKSAQ